MAQELVRWRAAPARVARREMLTDIAGADRTQQRIGQRMQPDIGIRMADEARVVRYRDAADHDMVTGTESVDIDALADPHIAEPRHQEPLGSGEILRRRHLQIVLAAGHHDRRDAGRLGNRRVVGQHVP